MDTRRRISEELWLAWGEANSLCLLGKYSPGDGPRYLREARKGVYRIQRYLDAVQQYLDDYREYLDTLEEVE